MKEETKPSGSRIRPPGRPPTAVGTAPQPGGAAPSPSAHSIVAIVGKQKGVGTSTIALNLAAMLGAASPGAIIISADTPSRHWMEDVTGIIPVHVRDVKKISDIKLIEPGIDLVKCSPPMDQFLKNKIEMLSERFHVVLDLGKWDEPREVGTSVHGFVEVASRVCWVVTPPVLQPADVIDMGSRPRHIVLLNRFQSGVSTVSESYWAASKRGQAILFPEEKAVQEAGSANRIFLREGVASPWISSLQTLHQKCLYNKL